MGQRHSVDHKTRSGRAVARRIGSAAGGNFRVLIRMARYNTGSLEGPGWRVLAQFPTRQEAMKAIADHQRNPLNARQFQYRLADR